MFALNVFVIRLTVARFSFSALYPRNFLLDVEYKFWFVLSNVKYFWENNPTNSQLRVVRNNVSWRVFWIFFFVLFCFWNFYSVELFGLTVFTVCYMRMDAAMLCIYFNITLVCQMVLVLVVVVFVVDFV